MTRPWFASTSLVLVLLAGPAAAALPTAPLTFPDGKTITVEVAATPRDRERGLMDRVKLARDYGMLFVFPTEQPLQFWMKNTWVSLDMVFIDKALRITEVHRNVPRSFPDTPEEKLARRGGLGQYVLEVPAGAAKRRGLKKGQRLKFSVFVPTL